jgi:hypothetical protein
MLQNRVDPLGRIIATSARGSWMGNRGVIHSEHKQIIRPFKHKAWIICKLEFKARKRIVMTPNRWTELFFLDEATALAAGHRPCFECRKDDAKRFKLCWIKGNPSYHFTLSTSINYIDEIIHGERIDKENKKVLHQRRLSDIPDGTFILMNDDPCLLSQGQLHRWTPFGYDDAKVVPGNPDLTILTPNSIVNAIREGYVPQMANMHSTPA